MALALQNYNAYTIHEEQEKFNPNFNQCLKQTKKYFICMFLKEIYFLSLRLIDIKVAQIMAPVKMYTLHIHKHDRRPILATGFTKRTKRKQSLRKI